MNEKILKNPITNSIKESINTSKKRLNFAVPFLSSFALSIINLQNTQKIIDKRFVTRFDETSLSSFDIPTIKYLLDCGFEIHFDNNIHLKLYISDNETFITSSNFTRGGFEENVELTVKIDSANTNSCIEIFNEIWHNSINNKITYDLLEYNMDKYEILKKREKFFVKNRNKIIINQINTGKFDLLNVIDEIFSQKCDYSKISNLAYEANKLREITKDKLKAGFNKEIFYVKEGHPSRRKNLFYDFVYGYEVDLAGTGLRELQYKSAFEHKNFIKAISYIFPEMSGMKPWNFEDKDVLLEFCNGIFDFSIPQYTEALPIRLVSYFYPDYFIPIFKLEHLHKVCDALGLETNATTKGDRLYAYNCFIADRMKALPFNNYIKSNISYHILYTFELFNRLSKGENYETIKDGYKEIWKKGMIEDGKKILTKLSVIK